jgi:aminoglycoside phosphotransferase (APT) family kinase protein
MLLEHVAGEPADLGSRSLDDVARLGEVVASAHGTTVEALEWERPGVDRVAAYVGDWLTTIEHHLTRLRRPTPPAVGDIDAVWSAVQASAAEAVVSDDFGGEEPLALVHGDIGPGNVLWSDRPVLIDWEYAHLGDPADEIAYVLAQHDLDASRRDAFLAGYRRTAGPARSDALLARVRWWEPMILVGSALWWLERWSRRADADEHGTDDPTTPRPEHHYLDEATRRLDRYRRLTHHA